jgi:hypothetical protein
MKALSLVLAKELVKVFIQRIDKTLFLQKKSQPI